MYMYMYIISFSPCLCLTLPDMSKSQGRQAENSPIEMCCPELIVSDRW